MHALLLHCKHTVARSSSFMQSGLSRSHADHHEAGEDDMGTKTEVMLSCGYLCMPLHVRTLISSISRHQHNAGVQSALFESRTHASNHKPSPQGDDASHVMQYIAVIVTWQ